jgi:tetratricopeptide (TPR) repeat protein
MRSISGSSCATRCTRSGEFEAGLAPLRDAERLARSLDDARRLARVKVALAHHLWLAGYPGEAGPVARRARAIAETLRDRPLTVATTFYAGTTAYATDAYDEAESLFSDVVTLLEGEPTAERCGLAGFPGVMARGWVASVLGERGEFARALAYGEDGLRLAESLKHPFSTIYACWQLGVVQSAKGDLDPAVALLERALRLAREWHVTLLAPLVSCALGATYALAGRVDEGLRVLDEATAAIESMGLRFYVPLFHAHRATARLLAGRFAEARASAETALTLARALGKRAYEALALHRLGEAAAHLDPSRSDVAAASYQQALSFASRLGLRPLEAHCRLGLGLLHRRAGRVDASRAELAAAADAYAAMGMTRWLAGAEGATDRAEASRRS